MTPILPPIEYRDRRFMLAIAALSIFLGLLPTLLGVTWLRKGDVFMGFNTFAPSDTNVYYSMMEEAKLTGHAFFTNAFTSEAQRPAFFEPLWAILGYASGVFHLPHFATFTIIRLAVAGLFLWVVARVVGLFCAPGVQRRLAFTLVALAMGVGGYAAPGIQFHSIADLLTKNPVDLWVSEGYTFTTLMHSPLFILSQLFLLLIFALAIRDEQQPGLVPHQIFLGLTALLAVLHPYDLPTVFIVLGVYFIVRIVRDPTYAPQHKRRTLTRLLLMGAVALGVGVYFLAVYRLAPGIGGWAKQNVTESPPVWNYLIGYGFLLVFAVLGWFGRRRSRDVPTLFLLTWVPVQALLLYAPTQIQRRFTNGLHPALALLASFALITIWQWVNKKRQSARLTFILRSATLWLAPLLFFYTPVYVVVRDIVKWEQRPAGSWSLYIQPRSTLAAMDWLATQPRGTILTSVATAYILSGRTLLPAYLAHGHQTIDFHAKGERLNAAFDGDAAGVPAFLRHEHIQYVFWTEHEQENFAPYDPSTKAYLKVIYQNATATVYAVQE